MSARLFGSLVFTTLLGLAGCSASTSPASDNEGATSPTFAAFCTGTLTHDTPLLAEMNGGAWEGGSSMSAAAGTPFLLAESFGVYGGYVIANDGTPMQLGADFVKGLVPETDFTSDCAPAVPPPSRDAHTVLLENVSLYPYSDLSGHPCAMTAGTELTSCGYAPTSDGLSISAPQIGATCGDTGSMYARQVALGTLIAK